MKRLVALCLGLIFVVSLVLGCTSNKNSVSSSAPSTNTISEQGTYTSKDEVALYIHTYKKLPANFISKKEARKLGWRSKGTLDEVAPGKSIGGDRFGNFEKQLPVKPGVHYIECDIDYIKGKRGPKRIVFSNEGAIYYCGDHYKTFEKLY